MPLPPGPQELEPIDNTPVGDYRVDDSTVRFDNETDMPIVPPAAPVVAAPTTYTADDFARLKADLERDKEIAVLRAQNEVLSRAPQSVAAPVAPTPAPAPVIDPYAQAVQEAQAAGYDDPMWVTQRAMKLQADQNQANIDRMLAAVRSEMAPAINTIKANRVIDQINPQASPAAREALAPIAHYFDQPGGMNPEQRQMMELALLGAEAKASQAAPQRGAPVTNYSTVRVNPTDLSDTNNFIASLSKEFGVPLTPLTKESYADLSRK